MSAENTRKYAMGESPSELERIHGIHESTVDFMGKLYLPPVDFTKQLRVLDSGTAGGLWLKDLKKSKGGQHELVGTDITPSFFPDKADAEGISYLLHDVTSPTPAGWAESFDFVHQRFVLGGVKKELLKDTIMNLIGLLKPGSWIELMESDVSEHVVKDGTNPAAPIWNLLRHLYLAMAVEPDVDGYLRSWFEEAGLVNIHEERITVPVGSKRNDPEMGAKSARTMAVTAEHLMMGAQHFGLNLFPAEELQTLPVKAYDALMDQGGYYKIYAIWAQKPE